MALKGNRLLPKNLEQQLFLNQNLRSKGYTSLPSPPSEFQAVNTPLQIDQNRGTLELHNHGLSDSDNDYEESDDSSDVSSDESP